EHYIGRWYEKTGDGDRRRQRTAEAQHGLCLARTKGNGDSPENRQSQTHRHAAEQDDLGYCTRRKTVPAVEPVADGAAGYGSEAKVVADRQADERCHGRLAPRQRFSG